MWIFKSLPPLLLTLHKPHCTQSGEWPERWKVEEGRALNKGPVNQDPETTDQIRIISLSPFLSKTYEKFVLEWILEEIGHLIDWNQYGGRHGMSVSHYLIELITFIQYNQDLRNKHGVIAAMIDFQKAFNRQNH